MFRAILDGNIKGWPERFEREPRKKSKNEEADI
jgi:hypothetical protein